jgi:hypothetical protein
LLMYVKRTNNADPILLDLDIQLLMALIYTFRKSIAKIRDTFILLEKYSKNT